MSKGARFVLKNGEPLQALRLGGRTSEAEVVASSGQLNAYDNKQLLHKIGQLMEQSSQGQIKKVTAAERIAVAKERNELVQAMWNDQTGRIQAEIQATLAAELQETAAREGLLRRLVIEEPLSQGQLPRIRVRYLNVVGAVADGPGEINAQLIRDKYYFPSEFNIVINLEIEEREIAQATGDILDEKYQEGLQASMVIEDRIWKAGADALLGQPNTLTTISGALTPTYLASIANLVSSWNLPTVNCILANDYWKDIATNPNWLTAFDPVSQAEVLLTGKLGNIYGMGVSTDGFRPPEQKVLEPGELYVTSSPEYHGAITTRGGIVPTPLNGPVNSRTTRGWFMSELISFMITNGRSVAKGVRG